jgi:hypothetical protein
VLGRKVTEFVPTPASGYPAALYHEVPERQWESLLQRQCATNENEVTRISEGDRVGKTELGSGR